MNADAKTILCNFRREVWTEKNVEGELLLDVTAPPKLVLFGIRTKQDPTRADNKPS